MAPPQEPHYLHPDFDPWKIKMDQIRDILIQHHVKTPTGIVKKQQLVDLFIQHIRPQVPKDIDESDSEEKAKPTNSNKARQHSLSTKQEQDIKTKPDPVLQEQEDIEAKLESVTTRPARLRRASSKARMVSEETNDTEVTPKPKRSNSRAKLRKQQQSEDDDSEPLVKPVRVKREPKERTKVKGVKGENFSDENPFQSGSESERKRSRSKLRARRPKESDKPATRDHVFKIPAQPTFSKFMHEPASEKGESSKSSTHLKPRSVSSSDLPPPKPLHLEPVQSDIQDLLRTFRRHLGPFWLILSTVLLAYGIWYRQTRIDIGFCTEAETKTPTPKPWFYPSCIPCPEHATCLRSDAVPECPPQYILKPQLLNFGNLFPLTSVCVLNRAKETRGLQVADAVAKLLQLHAGSIECSFSREKAPKDSVEYKARRGKSLEELRSQLEQLKDTSVSVEDFNLYWNLAQKELHRREDSVVFEEVQGEPRIRALKPRRSLGCQLRQALVGWIVQFKFFLLALVASVAGGFTIHVHIQKRRKEGRIVNGLVQNVLAKLADQAHYHYVDPLSYPDSYLPQLHLRDALLADVHSNVRRQEIWDKVQVVVDRNANVRVSSQEVRGEPYRVWEWVGPSGVLKSQHGGETGGSSGSTSNSHQPRHGDGGNNSIFHPLENQQDHGVMIGHSTRAMPKIPPRTGPHGSFFGIRRQDSEYLNPENSLYSSPAQDEYQARSHR